MPRDFYFLFSSEYAGLADLHYQFPTRRHPILVKKVTLKYAGFPNKSHDLCQLPTQKLHPLLGISPNRMMIISRQDMCVLIINSWRQGVIGIILHPLLLPYF